MILSFSEAPMRPMIEAGLRQRAGENVGRARVKRQTIRKLGPAAADLLERGTGGNTIPCDLDLWWQLSGAAPAHLGTVDAGEAPGIRVYWIEILHATVKPPGDAEYMCLRVVLPLCWQWQGDNREWMMFWSPSHKGGEALEAFARADGFDSVEAFRDYFVPNRGDRFEGILYVW